MVLNASTSPAGRGYRWPAEWEPHAATWLAWPHNEETWPGNLQGAIDSFVAVVAALYPRERVSILVNGEAEESAARDRLVGAGIEVDRGVSFHRIPTDDAWLRDTGPIFVVRDGERADAANRRAALDFGFDSWGGKYPPWGLDAAVAGQIAPFVAAQRFRTDFVLEGGSIDGNGRGTLLTTESCLLNPNRGGMRTHEAVERVLSEWLGARQVLWLAAGIDGDDTDGHVDDIARFVDPTTVVAVVEEDSSAGNFHTLRENRDRLRDMTDADGRPLAVVELPMPPRREVDGQVVPASYANFYLANGVALVPTFGSPSDDRAIGVLADLLPGRTVIGIDCRHLVCGLGAIHCITQQEPA